MHGWMLSIKSNFIGSKYICRFQNNILNALVILWENQFDQTALMLIIHSYITFGSVVPTTRHQKPHSKIFKGNCLFQILALASRRYLSPPHRWGIPAKMFLVAQWGQELCLFEKSVWDNFWVIFRNFDLDFLPINL